MDQSSTRMIFLSVGFTRHHFHSTVKRTTVFKNALSRRIRVENVHVYADSHHFFRKNCPEVKIHTHKENSNEFIAFEFPAQN